MDRREKTAPRVVVIIGRSGSGKTTLAKELAARLDCEELGFSYAGRALAAEEPDSPAFRGINDLIYACIAAAAARGGRVIVDGLASREVAERLIAAGHELAVLYLNTPDGERIARIARRQGVTEEEAAAIERAKARGKAKAGLDDVIAMAEYELDGRRDTGALAAEAEAFLQKRGHRRGEEDGP